MSGDSVNRAGVKYLTIPATGSTVIVLQIGTDLIVAGAVANPAASQVIYDSGYVGTDQSSIDTGVNGIPLGFAELEISLHGQGTAAAAQVSNEMQLNGDTGSNYVFQEIYIKGTTPNYGRSTRSFLQFGDIPAASAGEGTDEWSDTKIWMPFYDSPNRKQIISLSRGYDNTTPYPYSQFEVSEWLNGSAINRITWKCSSGNLKAGSRMRIIGR